MKRPKGKLKGKGSKESIAAKLPHKTTLAGLLALIDAAAGEEEINCIIGDLSIGGKALLYSALLYTQPVRGSADQPSNRSYALQILREFLL